MNRVSGRISESYSTTAPVTSSRSPLLTPKLYSSSSNPLWSRLRFFSLSSLVAVANAKVPPFQSAWLRRRTDSISSLPTVLERPATSFDSFHPVEALGEIKDRVATDVTVLSEQLRQRCQRVIDRFSKVDEYVLIM